MHDSSGHQQMYYSMLGLTGRELSSTNRGCPFPIISIQVNIHFIGILKVGRHVAREHLACLSCLSCPCLPQHCATTQQLKHGLQPRMAFKDIGEAERRSAQ